MRTSLFPVVLILMGSMFLLSQCSDSDDNQVCDSAVAVTTDNGICLVMEHSGLSADLKSTIEQKFSSGIIAVTDLMPLDELQVRIVDNPDYVIPEIGMGGYNPNTHEVILAVNAHHTDLANSLEANFIALLAHETHHAMRRRTVGYGSTLFQAAVSEGLADHFSIEVTGIAPPLWSVALQGSELENWMDMASNTWNESSYNHGAWFVGTDPNIPRWAGYAIGFELVKNYLSVHPEALASSLYDEPSSSFKP